MFGFKQKAARKPRKLTDSEIHNAVVGKGPYGEKVFGEFILGVRERAKRQLRKQWKENFKEDMFKDAYQISSVDFWLKSAEAWTGTGKLESYFLSICQNKYTDLYNKEKRLRENKEAKHGKHDKGKNAEVEDNLSRTEFNQIAEKLIHQIIDNENQVSVFKLRVKGYPYKDILPIVNYSSETACRLADQEARRKLAEYWLQNPEEAKEIKKYFEFLI